MLTVLELGLSRLRVTDGRWLAISNSLSVPARLPVLFHCDQCSDRQRQNVLVPHVARAITEQ